jgi:hypothetical protein
MLFMSQDPLDGRVDIGGTPRATKRPDGVAPPAGWTRDDGPPEPRDVPFEGQEVKGRPDPVRYGDWELKGIAVDF